MPRTGIKFRAGRSLSAQEALSKISSTSRSCSQILKSRKGLPTSRNRLASQQPEGQERCSLSDITRNREKIPVPAFNSVNNEPAPDGFTYVTTNKETGSDTNINWSIPTDVYGCKCKNSCGSDADYCLCEATNDGSCYYDRFGRLSDEFGVGTKRERSYIYECGWACACSPISCRNRVVQKGLNVKVKLCRTEHKGWGLVANEDIPKGTFVCEYVGELISDEEAKKRDERYMLDITNRDLPITLRTAKPIWIDAGKYGNVGRFINHGCEPNLTDVGVFFDHMDLRVPHMAFFTRKKVKMNEELTFNYGPSFWYAKGDQFSCQCGSAKCLYSAEKIGAFIRKYGKKKRKS